jgi:hypothetical protein
MMAGSMGHPPLPPGPRPGHMHDRQQSRANSDMELQAVAALERQVP